MEKGIKYKLLVVILIIFNSTISYDSKKVSHEPSTNLSKDNIDKISIDTIDINSDIQFAIEIDPHEARKHGVSLDQVGLRIRELLLGDDSLTIDQDLDSSFTFQNNKGRWVNIPIRSILIAP